MDNQEYLSVENISYRLDNRDLIADVSLSFSPGVLYGILGPNGSGKSTLMKTLTGIWKPTSGHVYWKTKDLLKQDRRTISKTISLVPQHSHMPFDFSVADMVMMGRYPHGFAAKDGKGNDKDNLLLKETLQTVDAWHLKDRSISQLSHGERQRLYIARALMTESPVLLLDEPTANLDICHQLTIWELLRQLLKNGKVVIVTSHDLMATERYCDKIAIMNNGRCIATGIYNEVMQPDILHSVFGVKEGATLSTTQFTLKGI